MLAIIATIQGLRTLESWPDSEAKRDLLSFKKHLESSEYDSDCPQNIRYADPLGNKISIFEWSVSHESVERHVRNCYMNGTIQVSTVWLGLNHSYFRDSMTIFETMIFGIDDDEELKGYQDRYSTLEAAEEGHEKATGLVLEYLTKKNRKRGESCSFGWQ